MPEYLKLVPEEVPAAALPGVWLILGERYGDNAQVMALGRALGWPFEVKQLYYDPDCPIPFNKRGSSIVGLNLARSAPLTAPWPDIVIAIGRRAAPISRWIKDQSNGAVMNVHLGRPRDAYHNYDLIFTTPQYGLPPGSNVMKLTFPITLNNEPDLEAASREWGPRPAHLPRPWTAVILGGPTTQLRFDRDVGDDLLAKAEAHAAIGNGSLLITTSPRTSMDVADLMQNQIKAPHFLFRWSRTESNPYLAFLKLADAFIVTNDSISMIAEAVDRMKPLYIYELPERFRPNPTGFGSSIRRHFRVRRENRQLADMDSDLIDFLYDGLTRLGKARPRRNALAFNRQLYRVGLARRLGIVGAPLRNWTSRRITEEERNAVIGRIKEVYALRHAEAAQIPK